MDKEVTNNSRTETIDQSPQDTSAKIDPYIVKIKADGSCEIARNVNLFSIPTLLRKIANQVERQLTE